MKTNLHLRHWISVSALALSPAALTPPAFGQNVPAAAAEAQSTVIKGQLKELDAQLDRLDELEESAPTPDERAAARARIKALKERRSELRKDYAQARYDALKADVKDEFDKLSAWTKRTFSNSPEARVDRALHDLKDQERSDARAARQAIEEARDGVKSTSNEVDRYRSLPTEENKLEAKAALAALDTEIERLEERCDRLPAGGERDAAKLRVKALKTRRSELASDFRQARYDALMSDVRSEWNRITR